MGWAFRHGAALAADGVLRRVAIGPAAHQVIDDNEGGIEVPGFLGQPGGGVGGGPGCNPVGVQCKERVQQVRHMVLAHGVSEEERQQFRTGPLRIQYGAEILLEAVIVTW